MQLQLQTLFVQDHMHMRVPDLLTWYQHNAVQSIIIHAHIIGLFQLIGIHLGLC